MRPTPLLALTALSLGCAARLPATALVLPVLHAHDQPIVLSQRVAIDEEPCEGAALTPLGALDGATLRYTTAPARSLQGTIVGRAGATAAELPRAAGLGEACVVQASLLAREDNPARDLPRARGIAEQRCQRESMHGCHVLAEIVAAAPLGATLSRQLFERACIGGYRPACVRQEAPRGDAQAVAGLLSPEAIRAVVQQGLAQVGACYEAALARDAAARGRVVVRFVIGGDGAVLRAGVAAAPEPLQTAAACIAQATRAWRFPAPTGGGVVTVNYPFNLAP